MSNQLMAGKRGLIMGLANDKSIAWGIAEALHGAGAEIALTYQGDAFKKRAIPLAEKLGCNHLMECDVNDDDSVDGVRVLRARLLYQRRVLETPYVTRSDTERSKLVTLRHGERKCERSTYLTKNT